MTPSTPEPLTVGSLLAYAVGHLEAAGVEDARRNAEWMLEEVLQRRRIDLYAHPERPVSAEVLPPVREMLARRSAREPIQYIVGHAGFFGLRLDVTPDVLIPRPETEQVVEHALALVNSVQAPRILDVGTGSGAIALALKHERPDADVFACDVSTRALAVARRNASRLDLPVSFLRCDIREAAAREQLPDGLDLLISNPPYIPDAELDSLSPEVVRHEPHQALFSGSDPLYFYRRILELAPCVLKPGGRVVFETHATYGPEVEDLAGVSGITDVQLTNDLAGLPRIVSGRWRDQP